MAQRRFVFPEVVGIAQFLFQIGFVGFVEVLEYVCSEALYLANDVPAVVVFYAVVDVRAYPLQHRLPLFQAFYHLVHCLFGYFLVVQVHPQVGSLPQFVCQIAQNLLEEGVYGEYPEVVVAVNEQRKGYPCIVPYHGIGHVRLLFHLVEILLRRLQRMGNAVELRQNAHLHFLRSLVREGYGKYVLIVLGVFHQQRYVFHGKGECLSRPCRSPVNG